MNVAASLFTANIVEFSWINLIFHLGYLNNFGLGNYYNVVYWTLGIEFQFYLLLGLLLPLFNCSKVGIFLFIIGFAIGTFIPTGSKELIFPYLSIFGLGIGTYYFKYLKLFHKSCYWVLILLLSGLIYYNLGLAVLMICIIGLLFIHFYRYQHTVINFFSRISYSLYLIHVPIGGKIINLGIRYTHTTIQKYTLVVIALTVSIFASYIFYLMIEKPFITISKKIIYSNTSAANSAS
ncbi:peptidoglycan/LPS O-acetylase OafA/YrhL [Pedobacter zeae]|uniref:Peptidoglycan/LPS O-acetylase OafA/YrhL n=1 Tax=Pedobacter zeae TaxID=1737356 RepID=A0A7W6K9P7_9SPHI|nr:peptidoglycan/LPS O-acetylase OafA/YrhL [Pedobacter zeae]